MKKEEKSELESFQGLIQSTKSYTKTLNYIKGLLDDPVFQKEVGQLRAKYNLPDKGLSEILYEDYGDRLVIVDPEHLRKTPVFLQDVCVLAEEYGLDFLWGHLLHHYVVYNNLDVWSYVLPLEVVDIKKLCDLERNPDQDFGLVEYEAQLQYLKDRAQTHPIALLINPYASQREIVDFVKKLYKHDIQPLQDRYKKPKARLGKIRKRSELVRERNRFIYANRHLSSKELAVLVFRKYNQMLEYPYINKIISDKKSK